MPKHEITRSMMLEAAFRNRENSFLHNSYENEQEPYHYMVNGEKENMLEAIQRNWRREGTGTLSKDPLTNRKYLFVSTVTMACRFCVEWGMNASEAYNASDLYIRRMDECQSMEAIEELAVDMMCFYCDAMAERQKQGSRSLPTIRTMDYIEGHLHDKITLNELAENAGISRTYLSSLFHQEMGVRLAEYIIKRRVETAKNMLLYTPAKVVEIAEYLAFSNASHFQRAFKQETGMTPNAYRRAVGNYALHRQSNH